MVSVFRDYAGLPFDSLVKPRVAEALNEITASRSAELIVQKREEVKSQALASARKKIGDVLVIEVAADASGAGGAEAAGRTGTVVLATVTEPEALAL